MIMNCLELTRRILLGYMNGNGGDVVFPDGLCDRVLKAVDSLSPLFDDDEENSFDVDVIRNDDNSINVAIYFDTYYFQFERMRNWLFDSVFADAERLLITVVGKDNLVNVKLIY